MLSFLRSASRWALWGCVSAQGATLFADSPLHFPWAHGGKHASASHASATAPYQVLHTAIGQEQPQTTLQQMSPKPGYAYGWFGSNSTPQFTRHLGVQRNYTQWKRNP
jgi:hypothetical protein